MNEYMDAAAAQVLGEANLVQIQLLQDYPLQWQAALEILIDELREAIAEYDVKLAAIPATATIEDLRNVPADRHRREANNRLWLAEKDLAVVNRLVEIEGGRADSKVYTLLLSAIERHQSLVEDPSSLDLALYESLNGRWGFEGILEELGEAL
jgi:hypothetical protein